MNPKSHPKIISYLLYAVKNMFMSFLFVDIVFKDLLAHAARCENFLSSILVKMVPSDREFFTDLNDIKIIGFG